MHGRDKSTSSEEDTCNSTTSKEVLEPVQPVDQARGWEIYRILAADIKLAHSVFAMPFALLASFMALDEETTWPVFAGILALIIVAMVTARTAAMLSNRILDQKIDARNPRTKARAVASGKVAVRDAINLFLGASAAFIFVCVAFGFVFDNWWPFLLSLPVLVWICIYPLSKRITWGCHLHLGLSLALSPLAAALAINPQSLLSQPAIWLLAGLVFTWVTGFDIIYALQDLQIDRSENLKSIPARFGYQRALWFSRISHLLSIVLLTMIAFIEPRFHNSWFVTSLALILLLLIVEHIVTAKHGTGKIQLTFLTINGIISCVLGAAGIASILLATPG